MSGISQMIPISQIRVNGRIRKPDPDKVQEIAASIAQIGLINPLSLASDFYLLAGGHRLAALKLLGETEASCIVSPFAHDSPEAGLFEIDENLARNELTVLEQAEYLHRREQLLEKMGTRKLSGDNRHSISRGVTVTPLETTATIAEIAGLSERAAQRRLQIARNLTQEQRDLIRPTHLADEQKELLEIARIKDEDRRTGVIKLMLTENPPQTVSEATRLYRIDAGEITSDLDILKPSNWWAFGRPKWQQEGFRGSIPGEIYANALYYFAPETGIAADGMAGSGMLKRVYADRAAWQRSRKFNLDIRLFDLHPREPFASRYKINIHNMTQPLPEQVDWLFIDPPYFGISSDLYEGELAQTQSYSRYLELMRAVVQAGAESLKANGVICILVTAYSDITQPGREVIDAPADMRHLLAEAGLVQDFRVYVSRGEQQRPNAGYMNIKAKASRRMFSDVCELLVFKKAA